MESEMEKTPQDTSKGQQEESREGYNAGGSYSRTYGNAGARTQRPRIHTQRAYSTDRRSSGGEDEGAFRPEGFGANLQSGAAPQQRQYRPRYNNYNNEGGGYQQRSSYNSNNRSGYQQRQEGGYRPRYNNAQEGEGGYQQRANYQPRQEGGYRPRQEGGYQANQEGGYQQRSNYQPRQEGGYRPRYNNEEGGYQQRGGYQQGNYRQRTPDYDPNAKYSLKKRIEYKEENIDPNEPLRLNKFLANAGVCSRREADQFIQSGMVKVNGNVVTELGTKVLRSDEIIFHDQPVTLEKKVYVLINKPKDYVTTSDDPQQRKTVMDLVKGVCPERIYPVGRLDRNTTGVLLLTNDGDLASKLAHPKFLKKKVYHVFLDKEVTEHDLQQIATGVTLDDGEVHADAIEYANDKDKTQVGIEIHSGKNRIVRRIFESLGYRVVRLDRVQFAGLTKKNLKRGDWRFLTEKEVDMLRMGAFE